MAGQALNLTRTAHGVSGKLPDVLTTVNWIQ